MLGPSGEAVGVGLGSEVPDDGLGVDDGGLHLGSAFVGPDGGVLVELPPAWG